MIDFAPRRPHIHLYVLTPVFDLSPFGLPAGTQILSPDS